MPAWQRAIIEEMKKKHHNEDMQQLYGREDKVSMMPLHKGMVLKVAPLKPHLGTRTRIQDGQVYRSKMPDFLSHGNAVHGASFYEEVDVGRNQHSRDRSITQGYISKFDTSSGHCFYSERKFDQSTSSSEAGKCKCTNPPDKCSSTVDKNLLADTFKNFSVKNLNELAAGISILDHRNMHQKYLNSGNKCEPFENRKFTSQRSGDFSVWRPSMSVHVHSNNRTSNDRSLGNKTSSELLMVNGTMDDEGDSVEQESHHSRGNNSDVSARNRHAACGGASENSLFGGSRIIRSGHSSDNVHAPSQNEDTSSADSGGAIWDIFRRQDVPKLIDYLQKHWREFRHINQDPIDSVSPCIFTLLLFMTISIVIIVIF